ncbi:hypothetical protein MF672_030770 [Actinomadura sp. ATCC 31491]|uniref:Tetratricopeptide repeat protein n=1 Tax=Actinomadura luzonensis TaxID=2805427 RepID=A0ABT0G0Q7_9ACTN|nr:hypothetical protein [Actinomadura luzonensis]MCK2218140.1 hypothetical protein [Actinomadura luzonensis]
MTIFGKKSLNILAGAVERVLAERDYSLVRDPELAERARRLAGTLTDGWPDVESCFIVAQFMWHRFAALGPKGRGERDIAIQLFARCLIQGDKPLPKGILPDIVPISFDLAVDLLQRSANARKAPPVDQVVDAWRRLESVTSDEYPERAMVLANLRVALLMRFGTTGDMADLDEAIIAGRQAVDAAAADDPDRVRYLIYLGDTLQMRIKRAEGASDVDEIVEVWREVLRALPGDSAERLRILSRFGAALLMRFARDETETEADLDEAIAVYRQAVQAVPAGHPDRDKHLSNLSTALEIRAEVSGEAADRQEARTVREEAAKATTVSPGKADAVDGPDDPSGLQGGAAPAETSRGRPWTERPERPAPATQPTMRRQQRKRQSRRQRRSGS